MVCDMAGGARFPALLKDTLASVISACFANEEVSEDTAKMLHDSLPWATFLRVSLRCGSGLFISGDILRPGATTVALVSLQSMAGLAMKQGTPVCLAMDCAMGRMAPCGAGSTQLVVCYPVGVGLVAASGAEQGTSFIGALQLGLAGPLPERAQSELRELCACLGPYLLLVSLTKVQDMAKTMRLPVGECICCASEDEEVDDAPYGRCMDDVGPGAPPGGAAPAQSIATATAASEAAAAADLAPSSPQAGPAAALRYRGVSLESQGGPSSVHKHSPYEAAAGSGGWVDEKAKGREEHFGGRFEGVARAENEEEGEEDPKTAVKRLASVALAPALRQGVLLNFMDPEAEAHFRRQESRSLVMFDLLFHIVYLVAFSCAVALDPAGVLGTSTNIRSAWVLALVVLTIVLAMEWYLRWRTWLLIPLTLLHVTNYRFAAAPALLRALPAASLRKLPWLLRCTGAEALLVFPLGNKLPFSNFLPIQLAGMLLMLTLLPGPCQALAPLLGSVTGVCLPSEWGVRGGAALFGAGFVLPTCALYFAESRTRAQFGRVLQAMRA